MVFAVIGMGEVGSLYSLGLKEGGAVVKGYNRNPDNPRNAARLKLCAEQGIIICGSVQEAVKGADIVMSLTNAKAAVQTAESAAPYLSSEQIYIEFNSATPDVKSQVESLLEGRAQVLDGTTMASVHQLRNKTPVNLSGEKAAEVSAILNSYGMNTRCVGQKVGQAAALKVLRSVFMKGIEAVLVECMHASNHYGMADAVLDSVLEFFSTKPLKDILEMLITTDAIHCQRRADEMTAIVSILESQSIEATMSKATIHKLEWVASHGMEDKFEKQVPSDIHPVLDILCGKTD